MNNKIYAKAVLIGEEPLEVVGAIVVEDLCFVEIDPPFKYNDKRRLRLEFYIDNEDAGIAQDILNTFNIQNIGVKVPFKFVMARMKTDV